MYFDTSVLSIARPSRRLLQKLFSLKKKLVPKIYAVAKGRSLILGLLHVVLKKKYGRTYETCSENVDRKINFLDLPKAVLMLEFIYLFFYAACVFYLFCV